MSFIQNLQKFGLCVSAKNWYINVKPSWKFHTQNPMRPEPDLDKKRLEKFEFAFKFEFWNPIFLVTEISIFNPIKRRLLKVNKICLYKIILVFTDLWQKHLNRYSGCRKFFLTCNFVYIGLEQTYISKSENNIIAGNVIYYNITILILFNKSQCKSSVNPA